jgi:hypothetical protein
MKLSFYTMQLHPFRRRRSEELQEDREAIVVAEKFGAAEALIDAWLTNLAETVTSCLSFFARLAYGAKRIKLGSATVFLSPGERIMATPGEAMCERPGLTAGSTVVEYDPEPQIFDLKRPERFTPVPETLVLAAGRM